MNEDKNINNSASDEMSVIVSYNGKDAEEEREAPQGFVKRILKKADERPLLTNVLLWLGMSLILTFLLEILNRQSLISTLKFVILNFHMFLINAGLVLLCNSFMLIVKRKFFAFAIPGVLLLTLSIINAVLLNIKRMPFAASDMILAGEAYTLFTMYLKPWQIALILVGIAAAIALIVWIFKKSKRFDVDYKRDLPVFIPVFVVLLTFAIIINIFEFFPRKTDETTVELYERTGFVYAFYKSAGPAGVSKPTGHSEKEIDELKESLGGGTGTLKDKPNIIVLQLESFFDMTQMVNSNNPNTIGLSEDPVPNFRKLCEEGPSGYLYVPSFGGGTSNVEFEVLTGMNLEHFQIGESPYYTLLGENVLTDATPFNMKKLGYTTHAIHNYTATFYERYLAYNNLGFDTFTPLEYMNGVTYNCLSWPKDGVLTHEIMAALEAPDGEDFVFTVSVQGHGPYPENIPANEFEKVITVSGNDFGKNTQTGLTYYASTIKEMDNMLGELVEKLGEYDEKCMLVVYGDHLPALDFSVNWISAPSAYASQYVIWTNYGLKAEDKDLNTYKLMAHVQSILGTSEGILTSYHQEYADKSIYQEKLHSLEYELTNEKNFRHDTIKYSVHPVKIESVTAENGKITVTGENFTPFSRVYYDGVQLETVFESAEKLTATLVTTASINETKVSVAQLSKDGLTVLETIKPGK